MDANCWICGAATETAEHKLKKSDIVRGHGKGPYRGDDALLHYCEGRESVVQGPNSKVLKYSKNLCSKCNNEKTQPFDRAYEHFISWVFDNESIVLQNRTIDFEAVYPTDWETAQLNLYKYLVKAFGCKIVDANAPVPSDLISLLDQDSFQTGLRITISVNEGVLLMAPKDRDGFVRFSAFAAWDSADHSKIDHVYWESGVSWLTFQYWYCMLPHDDFTGDIWVADKKVIQLGNIPVSDCDQKLFH
jgi:hypothetical protein